MNKIKIILCENVTIIYYLEKNDTSLIWVFDQGSSPINAGLMFFPSEIEVQDMDIIKKYFKTEELE